MIRSSDIYKFPLDFPILFGTFILSAMILGASGVLYGIALFLMWALS